MLRNAYLEPYEAPKKPMSDYEKELESHNLSRILESQRPLEYKRIKKFSDNTMQLFIDDIMCNNEINTLLYSSNAKKELAYYLDQKKALLKVIPFKKFIEPRDEDEEKDPYIYFFRKNKSIVPNNLKVNLDHFKSSRNRALKDFKDKNDEFMSCFPQIDIKLKKLFYKPINEIRLKGYRKAFKQCLSRSLHSKKFHLPDIELNMNNVFSRLFHNEILTPKVERMNELYRNKYKIIRTPEKTKDKVSRSTNKSINNLLSKSNDGPITNYKRGKHKKIIIKPNTNESMNLSNFSKIPVFNLKNVNNNWNGKEFISKITPKMKERCWSALSGGPNSKFQIVLDDKPKIRYNKNIFNIPKSKSKINEEFNDEILYNTLVSGQKVNESEFIDVKHYRDLENNSDLHIAVNQNSKKLVKYFLSKNLDPNQQNNQGQTPLHLAMIKNNRNIIELLIDAGGDVKIKDKEGRRPYDLASRDIRLYFKLEEHNYN